MGEKIFVISYFGILILGLYVYVYIKNLEHQWVNIDSDLRYCKKCGLSQHWTLFWHDTNASWFKEEVRFRASMEKYEEEALEEQKRLPKEIIGVRWKQK